MKTLIFGALMGLFGSLAIALSSAIAWPAWVLFLAWVCFYLYGKSSKRILIIYFQIMLGVLLSIVMQTVGIMLSKTFGELGQYVSIFVFVGSLAFLIKVKHLHDLTAWFLGFVVFFGTETDASAFAILKNILGP